MEREDRFAHTPLDSRPEPGDEPGALTEIIPEAAARLAAIPAEAVKLSRDGTLPDGEYAVELLKLEFGRAEKGRASAPLVATWHFRICAGPHTGRRMVHRVQLDALVPDSIAVCRQDLQLLGLSGDSLDELLLIREDLAGARFLCRLATRPASLSGSRVTSLKTRLTDNLDTRRRLSEKLASLRPEHIANF